MNFKLNYYFELYKDYPIRSSEDFRNMFTQKHGNFPLIGELIIMINRYQVKKYGQNISDCIDEIPNEYKKKKVKWKMHMMYTKLGTKKERIKRKIEYERMNKHE